MEIVKQDKSLMEALRAKTGEGGKSFQKIPSIVIDYNQFTDKEETKVNKKFGQLAFEHIEGEGETFKKTLEHLGDSIQCVILRNRYKGKYYDAASKTITAFTREFDQFQDEIQVFDNDKNIINKGVWRDVKEGINYKMSSRLILYVWFQEKVYRLNVSGGSMGALWDYQRRLFAADSSQAAIITELSTIKEKKGKVTYFDLKFGEAGLFDVNEAIKLTTELNEALNIYETTRDAVKGSNEPELAIPQDDQFKQSQECIKIEEVPF